MPSRRAASWAVALVLGFPAVRLFAGGSLAPTTAALRMAIAFVLAWVALGVLVRLVAGYAERPASVAARGAEDDAAGRGSA